MLFAVKHCENDFLFLILVLVTSETFMPPVFLNIENGITLGINNGFWHVSVSNINKIRQSLNMHVIRRNRRNKKVWRRRGNEKNYWWIGGIYAKFVMFSWINTAVNFVLKWFVNNLFDILFKVLSHFFRFLYIVTDITIFRGCVNVPFVFIHLMTHRW